MPSRLITPASVGAGCAFGRAPVPPDHAGVVAAILDHVGFNPYRKFRARPLDYALVAGCIAVAIVLVIWALAG